MTVPQEYALAGQRFDGLLSALMAGLDLGTRHQAYAVLFAVLHTFRRRLDANEVLTFASALPALLRAMFVADWDGEETMLPFAKPADYDLEARGVRKNHNLLPVDGYSKVAKIIREHCEAAAFERALNQLPAEASQFWNEIS